MVVDFKNLRQILDLYEDQCGVGKKVEGSSGDQIQGQQTTPKTIVNQQAENEQQVQQQTLPLLPETQQTPQVTTTKRKARVTRTAKETAQVGEALVGKGGVEQQNETVATVATKKHVNPEGGGQLQERERTGVQQNTTKPPKKKQATGTNDTGIAGTKERASVGRSTVHTAPTLQPYAFDQAGPMRKSFSTYRPTCLWSEQEHKGTLPLLCKFNSIRFPFKERKLIVWPADSSNDNDLSCVPTKPDFTKGTEDDPLVVGIRMFESFTKGWGPVIVSTAPGEEGLIMGYIQDNGDLLRGLLGASHSLEGKVVWRKTMEFGTTMIVFGSVEYRALTCPGNSHEFTRAHVPGDSETNKPSDQRVGGNRYG